MDRSTISAAREGDRDALDRLLAAAWPRAWRLAYGILGNRQAAEDAAQDALVQVVRTLRGLRDADRFDAWLATIVTRIAVRAARRARLRRTEPLDAFGSLAAAAAPVDASLDLARALTRLEPAERALLQLAALGHSSAEIGAALGMRAGTVRYQLSVVRARLRDATGVFDDEPAATLVRMLAHHA